MTHSKQPTKPGAKQAGLSYADAGVSIARGDELVERIKAGAGRTARPGVLGGLGGFGGLFDVRAEGYIDPIMVSSTDGVGTKLLLAIELGHHETIGFDLVAMCVNDIIVQGAEPLFFLDYFATGKLELGVAETVINGIAAACEAAGAALLGGESAEMPGMYPPGHYDLAGFCVGAVERDQLLDGSRVSAGDRLLGLAANGVHSNGFSLVRKIIEHAGVSLDMPFAEDSLGGILLEPTRIYVRPLLEASAHVRISAMAHITGGGLTENLPRVLPPGLAAEISLGSWQQPEIFRWLAHEGGVQPDEMLKTFNCGIGMVVVVPPHAADELSTRLVDAGEQVFEIGEIIAGDSGVHYCD